MKTQEVTIVNKLGLHARAAAKLVGVASHFESSVLLEKSGSQVNGKSIMGVMMLAAGKGSKITITVDGNDEETALTAVLELINNRFGESE
jgi:phosphocarrier protein HPr